MPINRKRRSSVSKKQRRTLKHSRSIEWFVGAVGWWLGTLQRATLRTDMKPLFGTKLSIPFHGVFRRREARGEDRLLRCSPNVQRFSGATDSSDYSRGASVLIPSAYCARPETTPLLHLPCSLTPKGGFALIGGSGEVTAARVFSWKGGMRPPPLPGV